MEHDEVRRISEELEELLNQPRASVEEETEEKKEAAAPGTGVETAGTKEQPAMMENMPEETPEEPFQPEDGEEAPESELQEMAENVETPEYQEKTSKPAEAPGNISDEEESNPESDKYDTAIPQAAILPEEIYDLEEVEREEKSREKSPRRWHRKNYIRPVDGLIMAFVVPVIIMIIIFAQRGIFPFGEESFLRTDMYHQYAPFFSEFQYKLTHGKSLLYSWDIGMGVNFSALYAYYLASPLNWLLILCPKNLIIEFMTYSIVLKIGLCGLTFAYYLRKHCNTTDFGVAFFGIFYALSGYMAAYRWNIMWLDCILLFPLIMLGLEMLVKERKCLLYCTALGMSILSNYYISIMICIFMVLYFVVLLILEKKKSIVDYAWNIVHFGIYSLVAGGLAAVVLLPEVYALQATASSNFNFPKTVTSYFSIFDMIARHMGNVEVEIGLDHWPNIYCGVAVFIFLALYLVCKKISVREKIMYCGMLLFFFASFSLNVLNFIWHGFHYPNSLPCRQSFIYVFLVLFMCYQAYRNLKDISWKTIVIAFFGSIVFVILAEKLVEQEHFKYYVYYVAILFLAIYAGLLYLYKYKKVNFNVLMMMVLAVVAVESAVNTTITSVTTTSRTNYMDDNEDVANLMELIRPADTFYRVEKVTRKTKNDGAWMNFPSVSLFSSTANASLTSFFKMMGCEGNTNAYSITGSTPLVDSLFSVKYGLYSGQYSDDELLTFKGQSGDTYLYERNYTLPLGFVVDEQMENNWQMDLGNPAEVQNDLCNVIGAEQVLVEAAGETNGDTFRFTPETSGDYYAYVINRKIDEITVTKGEDSKTFKNVDRGFLVEMGYCPAGQEVVIKSAKEGQDLTVRAYLFNNQGLRSAYEILNRYPMTVTGWADDKIEGVVTVEKPGLLFTSIPYDHGWTIMVDGSKRMPRKMFGAFMGVSLSEGTHTVVLEYEPEGLRTGFYITAGCVIFLIIVSITHDLLERMKREEEEYEAGLRREEEEARKRAEADEEEEAGNDGDEEYFFDDEDEDPVEEDTIEQDISE